MAQNDSKQYLDILTAFPSGINSGVAPILLPKDQMSFAINTTFRGGYATDRPPIQKLTLDFGGDAALETAVRKGFFQGAGVYRPDFGPSQNIAQISGRIFTFTENGASWLVKEITIPGDPNDATTSQVWMWQSEKWMIISDGSAKFPIFYDGVISRRSYGPSQILGTVIAVVSPATPLIAGIGGIVQVTLAANWEHPALTAGPFNVPVQFNGAHYQPTSISSTGYNVDLTNVSAVPGQTLPIGTSVMVQPGFIGTVSSVIILTVNGPLASCGSGRNNYTANASITVRDDEAAQISIGQGLLIPHGLFSGFVWQVTGIGPSSGGFTQIDLFFPGGCMDATLAASIVISAGDFIQMDASPSPAYSIGNTLATFVSPAVGATVTVRLNLAYAGANDQLVWIGTQSYTVRASVVPAPSTTLYLVNLTDTATAFALGNITSVPEIPACRMGTYGQGQNWFSSTDGTMFGPGDLVGGSSGTQAYNYRDAVLKTADLEVMGWFHIPASGEIITSMTFVATLDKSLGQGPLEVGVQSGFFSCKAPFTLIDFQGTSLTQAITDPILTKSLIGFGPVGQNSTIVANSDTIFRSSEGVGSLILARRQFSDLGGNVPISREMTRIIDKDNKSLLSYSSAIVFDNRLHMTCAPNVSNQGVFHMGELILNYDLISSLRGKASPVWEGLWTGVNVLQYLSGLFGPVNRAFSFTFNITDSQIELYELLPTGDSHFDNGNIRIKWVLETPVIFNAAVKTLTDVAKLMDGEMYLTEVNGLVDVSVLYRPVFYPCWRPWHTFSVCSDMSASNAKQLTMWPLGFGEPTARECDEINNQSFREGVGFQLRFEFTGHCKLWGVKALGRQVPNPAFTKPAGTCDPNVAPTCLALNCDVPNDLEVYNLDNLPQPPLPPPQITYSNDTVYYDAFACGLGQVLTVIPASALPGWITLDNTAHKLVGHAGTFRNTTKASANTDAQTALNTFAANAIANGTLICAPIPLVLFTDDFESYANGVLVNGLGQGNWTNLPSPYVDT